MDVFVSWILNKLLPHLNPFPKARSVICLDNLNIYLDAWVRIAFENKGCLIKFLPPYSLDYSPIELTFSMLKVSIPFVILFLFILILTSILNRLG
jgi:transposase